MTKPILKWVGGKTQLMDAILQKFPTTIGEYHEIFVGGGSVLMALCASTAITVQRMVAYDSNEALIWMYKNIQSHPEELFAEISRIASVYFSISTHKGTNKPTTPQDALSSRESFYYWCRLEFNRVDRKTLRTSALFIFLNKTGFRGLYREGPNGYNVPYGNYKNPAIVSRPHLLRVHALLKDVRFEHLSFEHSLARCPARPDTFIYLDPPYVPVTKTSFTSYSYNCKGFDHSLLFQMCRELKSSFLMSNSNTDYTLRECKEFTVESVQCRRRIHSTDPSSTSVEVLVWNY